MPKELEHIRVQSLMEEGMHRWDDEILSDICSERDRDLIKRIPLSTRNRQDSWFWMLEDKGLFTVRSCYRRLQGEMTPPHSMFWKKLWSVKLSGKVINFLWRTCSSCLPTATALAAKMVQIDSKCSWCLVHNETAVHVLFECGFANSVWVAAGINNLFHIVQNDTVFDVLKRVFETCTTEQITLITLLCWSIWNRRNKWAWERNNVSVFGVKAAAMNLLSDWRKAQLENNKQKPILNSSTRHWSKPPHGWIKINVDASIFSEIGCVSIGCVPRDEHGQLLHARCQRLEVSLQPREAEALSPKEALSWTKALGYMRCIFETDAKMLADACNGGQGRSYFHTIVMDCVEYFKHYDNVLVEFVHRSANGVTHLLARATHSMSDLQEWVGIAPEFVSNALIYDIS